MFKLAVKWPVCIFRPGPEGGWHMSCEKMSQSHFSFFCVARALLYETAFYLKSEKKYNFDEKINLSLDNTIFPVICTGFSLQRLLFQLVQNFKALPSFWRTPWFPKQSYCTPSPPPNGCSSARSTPTWPQASFNNSIRFACSSEVNVFTVSHLDFIKGVGTKALTKVEKLIWRVWNVWNS